jgi:hypothetical protein
MHNAALTDTPAMRPWHREPMVWLIAAIPLVTVFAGLTTVAIAYRHSDAVITDDYRKDGLAINREPKRDLAAQRIGITAELAVVPGTLTVHLSGAGAERPARLVVLFSHATRSDVDQLVTLERQGADEYSARLGPLERGHWYVEVSPMDRAWRLIGDFVDAPGTISLRPRTMP